MENAKDDINNASVKTTTELKQGSSTSMVMYHYVRPIADSRYPRIKGLELSLFEQQLDCFLKKSRIITMQQLQAQLQGHFSTEQKTILPQVVLTFDDGYLDHYRYVFPLLEKHKIQGSFFIPTSILCGKVLDVNKIHFILANSKDLTVVKERIRECIHQMSCEDQGLDSYESLYQTHAIANRWDDADTIFVKRMLQNVLPEEERHFLVAQLFSELVSADEEDFAASLYMSKEQMLEMKAAGMYFGLHGHEHIWLNRVSKEVAINDIETGIRHMEGLLDMDCMVMNYPYGGVNASVAKIAESLGCHLGVTVEPGDIGDGNERKMWLPRWDTNDFWPKGNRMSE